ncbi:hypothetical protein CYMTET_32702, partial [Cymbomonas tetramitiformis]
MICSVLASRPGKSEQAGVLAASPCSGTWRVAEGSLLRGARGAARIGTVPAQRLRGRAPLLPLLLVLCARPSLLIAQASPFCPPLPSFVQLDLSGDGFVTPAEYEAVVSQLREDRGDAVSPASLPSLSRPLGGSRRLHQTIGDGTALLSTLRCLIPSSAPSAPPAAARNVSAMPPLVLSPPFSSLRTVNIEDAATAAWDLAVSIQDHSVRTVILRTHVVLEESLPSIDRGLEITGECLTGDEGMEYCTIDGQRLNRVMYVARPSANLTMRFVKLTNGYISGGWGGANLAVMFGATAVLQDCHFTLGYATEVLGGGGVLGGFGATLLMERCVVSGNTIVAALGGAGLGLCGATAQVVNSSISGNYFDDGLGGAGVGVIDYALEDGETGSDITLE